MGDALAEDFLNSHRSDCLPPLEENYCNQPDSHRNQPDLHCNQPDLHRNQPDLQEPEN